MSDPSANPDVHAVLIGARIGPGFYFLEDRRGKDEWTGMEPRVRNWGRRLLGLEETENADRHIQSDQLFQEYSPTNCSLFLHLHVSCLRVRLDMEPENHVTGPSEA